MKKKKIKIVCAHVKLHTCDTSDCIVYGKAIGTERTEINFISNNNAEIARFPITTIQSI